VPTPPAPGGAAAGRRLCRRDEDLVARAPNRAQGEAGSGWAGRL